MKTRPEEISGPEGVNPSLKLVVVADLGHLKAYRLEERPEFSRPRMELIQAMETVETRHLREDVTDQAGRYRKEPAVAGALSDGEEHNASLERRNRTVRMLAETITTLMAQEHVLACYLAADPRINQSLLGEMDQRTRSKIQKNIPANLSKLEPEELVERFSRFNKRPEMG
ncbi:MAG TPA: host attachment protein [Verrucomicrobiae bacterium]|nr:host attachment protein [Verrucomicrobiae bacterium]